jgi:hypothetical protein
VIVGLPESVRTGFQQRVRSFVAARKVQRSFPFDVLRVRMTSAFLNNYWGLGELVWAAPAAGPGAGLWDVVGMDCALGGSGTVVMALSGFSR